MYEPSRNLMSFHIAGFKNHEGAMVLSDLKPGIELQLVAEPDNPFDAEAIAIMYGSVKLGYIPANMNGMLSVMFHYGHAGSFECRILQVAPEKDPWEQVRVAVFVRDAR